MKKLLILSVVTSLLLVGCLGGSQANPLHEYIDAVENAVARFPGDNPPEILITWRKNAPTLSECSHGMVTLHAGTILAMAEDVDTGLEQIEVVLLRELLNAAAGCAGGP